MKWSRKAAVNNGNNKYVGPPYGEYADGTDRRTDERTPDLYITLSAVDAARVIT